jgi:hypothetical protein
MNTLNLLHISGRPSPTPRLPNLVNLQKVHSQGQSATEKGFGIGLDGRNTLSINVGSTLVCGALKHSLPPHRSQLVTSIIISYMQYKGLQGIGYDWKSLPANTLVVDVGGGVGTASLSLAKEFSQLKFVIQDRQPVVDAGVEVPLSSQIDQDDLTCHRFGRKSCLMRCRPVGFSSKVASCNNMLLSSNAKTQRTISLPPNHGRMPQSFS